jgi:hypothetical protein
MEDVFVSDEYSLMYVPLYGSGILFGVATSNLCHLDCPDILVLFFLIICLISSMYSDGIPSLICSRRPEIINLAYSVLVFIDR